MAIITITRGIQSGGREFARRLAEKLGYSCLSREVIAACSRKYNMMEQDLYEKLIKAPSRWRRLSQEHARYLVYIQCSLIDAAKQDNIVYHGYAGRLFLRGVGHAMKIRLEAPLVDRVRAEMKETGKTYEDALEYIKREDAQRNRWVKFLYGEDWHDAGLYDLSINLKAIPVNIACDAVATVLEHGAFRTTDESKQRLEELSLECEVRAAIATDDKLWAQPLTVTASGSVITLGGTITSNKLKDAAAEIASRVKGVAYCKTDILVSRERHPVIYGRGHD